MYLNPHNLGMRLLCGLERRTLSCLNALSGTSRRSLGKPSISVLAGLLIESGLSVIFGHERIEDFQP